MIDVHKFDNRQLIRARDRFATLGMWHDFRAADRELRRRGVWR